VEAFMSGKNKQKSSVVKSYYLMLYYTYLIEAISTVYGKDKSKLLMLMLRDTTLDDEEIAYIRNLPAIFKHEIIEMAVKDIFQIQFSELKTILQKSYRLKGLKQKVTEVDAFGLYKKSKTIAFRISSEIGRDIDAFVMKHHLDSKDIIELSVEYFLTRIAEQDFLLIYTLFSDMVDTL